MSTALSNAYLDALQAKADKIAAANAAMLKAIHAAAEKGK